MSSHAPIPFEDFAGSGPRLHFAHANGYPPGAYRPLFHRLAPRFQVVAMRQRPLWPGADPQAIRDWRPLADDLGDFLDQQNLHGLPGAGHSFGAIHTLRLALQQPDRFSAIALIDPVLFTPVWTAVWRTLRFFKLDRRMHPLVKAAKRRRTEFASRAEMFANYRKKSVFHRLSDEALQAYVDALACEQPGGGLRLCYPIEWEARIYATNLLADCDLWRGLPALKPRLLLIYGAASDTFSERAARAVRQRLPNAALVRLPNAGHLAPLEYPDAVAGVMIDFLTHDDTPVEFDRLV